MIAFVVLATPSLCAGQSSEAQQWFERAIKSEEPREQLRCLNNAIQADPSLWQAWAVRADTQTSLGDYDKAKADALRATALAPEEFIPWAVLARARLASGQHAACITAAATAFKKQGDKPPSADSLAKLHVFRAEAYRALHRESDALKDLNDAIEEDPRCLLALDRRVSLLVAMNRMKDAKNDCDYLQSLAKEKPDDVGLQMTLGQAQYMVDRYTEAVATANFVLAKRRNYVPAFLLRGRARRYMKEYHAALEDEEKALAADPGNLDAHLEEGLLYCLLDQGEKAKSHLEFVLSRAPSNVTSRRLLAQVHLDLKDWDAVIDDANRLLRIAGDDKTKAGAYYVAGVALRRMGDSKSAKNCFDKAIALDPKLANAMFERALVLSDQGDQPAAVSDCDRGLAITADSPFGCLIRGRAYARLPGNRQKAIADLRRVLKLAPSSHLAAWSYVSLASLARESEDHEGTIAWATRCIEMPVDPVKQPEYMDPISIAYVVRAASRRVAGKQREALDDCTLAIKLDEKYAGAYVERRRVPSGTAQVRPGHPRLRAGHPPSAFPASRLSGTGICLVGKVLWRRGHAYGRRRGIAADSAKHERSHRASPARW